MKGAVMVTVAIVWAILGVYTNDNQAWIISNIWVVGALVSE